MIISTINVLDLTAIYYLVWPYKKDINLKSEKYYL